MLIFWGVTHHGCMGGMVYLLIHDKWMVDCLWQICKIRRDTMHGCMNPKIGILQEFIGQPMTTHGSQVLRSFEVCSPRPESATAVYGFLQEQGAIILVAGFKYLLFSPLLYGNDPIWLKELNPPTSFLPRQTKKTMVIRLPMLEESNKQQMYGTFEGFLKKWCKNAIKSGQIIMTSSWSLGWHIFRFWWQIKLGAIFV